MKFLPLVFFFYMHSASAIAPLKNISYQNAIPSQKLDVYFPNTPPPYKTVMLIHGGCFVWGEKDSRDNMNHVRRLLRLGFAVVSVNYRLAIPDPEHPEKSANTYPAALRDVEDALCWIQQQGESYSLDLDRVMLMGYSAGATLANYLGTGHDSGRPRRCKARIAGVIDFFGRTNFLRSMETFKNSDGLDCGEKFVGQRRDDANPQAGFQAADILSHLDPAKAAPILALHGDADGAVNVKHSLDLCAGLPGHCTLKILHGADHMFTGAGEMEMAYAEVARFLEERALFVSQNETRLAFHRR